MQDMAVFATVISIVTGVSGVLIGWSGRSRSIRQEDKKEASDGAILHADVEYIKRGVDDIRLEQRAQGKRIDELAERVTRVEESTKQAHKRMDRIDLAPRHERED